MKSTSRARISRIATSLLFGALAACSGAPTDGGGDSGGSSGFGGQLAGSGGSPGAGGKDGSGGKSTPEGSGGNGVGGTTSAGGSGAGGTTASGGRVSGGSGAGGTAGSGGRGSGGATGSGGSTASGAGAGGCGTGGRGSGGALTSGGAVGSGGKGTGGATGAGGGTGSPFDWGTTTYNASGGASVAYQGHFTGQSCLSATCHKHNITYGGTIYQSNGSSTAGNVQIGIRAGSNLVTTYSGSQGNFYGNISGASWATAQIAIRNASGTAVMPTNASASGECNSCHGSSNRLVVP